MFLNLKNSRLILVLLILLNFIVKIFFISNNSIGGDEPFSIYHAQMNILSIINLLLSGNNPPLYEILLHFWIKLFGISALSVRFPSLLFSCVTLVFIYKIGKDFFNLRVAFYACMFFIFSNYQISFAHEARVYALFGMLTAMSMYYYLNITSTTELKISTIIVFILINTLIIYAHYFGFFVLTIQFLHFITNKQLIHKYWKLFLSSAVSISLLYAPWMRILLTRFSDSAHNGTWLTSPSGIESLYNMLWKFSNAPIVTVLVIVIFIFFLVKYIINYKKNNKFNMPRRLVIIWFVFPFFFMFLISYWIPMFLDRYLMFVSISFCLLLAILLDNIVIKKYKYIIPSIVVASFILTSKPNISNKRNVFQAIEKIKDLEETNSLIIYTPHWFAFNFSYYYDIEIFKKIDTINIYKQIDDELAKRNIFGIDNINDINYQDWERIIILDATGTDLFVNENSLNDNYSLIDNFKIHEIFKVYKYIKK